MQGMAKNKLTPILVANLEGGMEELRELRFRFFLNWLNG